MGQNFEFSRWYNVLFEKNSIIAKPKKSKYNKHIYVGSKCSVK